MYIQYVGFNGTAGSRVYGFHVIEMAQEPREFTVEVHSEAFGPARLSFQDGPEICLARLKKRLQEETQDARAEGHLSISEQDVRAYLEAHRPIKGVGRRRQEKLDAEAREGAQVSPERPRP